MLSLERLFSLAGVVVTPVWVLLIFAPRWKWTQRMATFLVPILLGCLYGVLIRHVMSIPGGSFNSLAGVTRLFASPQILLAGWIHYLVGDLFTGAWQARDAARLQLSKWVVAPCLVLTFLFAPLGLMAYLLLRFALRKRIGV